MYTYPNPKKRPKAFIEIEIPSLFLSYLSPPPSPFPLLLLSPPHSPIPHNLIRNPIILPIPQRKIHILQTLRRRALEKIINRRINHDALAARVDGKAPNLHAVLAGDVLDDGRLAGDFDEFFAGVPVLVEVADVARGHGAGEGDGDCVLGWGLVLGF